MSGDDNLAVLDWDSGGHLPGGGGVVGGTRARGVLASRDDRRLMTSTAATVALWHHVATARKKMLIARADWAVAVRRRRCIALALGTTAVVAAGAVAFVASPAILARMNRQLSDSELNRLGQIGEAYGGISALLSGLAVIGLLGALLLQIRQIKTSQAHSIRMMQIELMRMLIDDPSLRPPSAGAPIPTGLRRRNIFTNLMFKYLEMGFEIGYFPDVVVKREVAAQFQREDVRRFWRENRLAFASGVFNRSTKRFFDTVDSAYGEAMLRVGSSAEDHPRSGALLAKLASRKSVGNLLLGLTFGAIAAGCWVYRRSRHRSEKPCQTHHS